MILPFNSSEPIEFSGSIALYRNSPDQVGKAIGSFFAAVPNAPLIVIDNSPDEQLRPVVETLGGEYIFAGRNLGFGGGHNVALQRCMHRSEYHLVLNPDVAFAPDALPALRDFMDRNPRVGLVMPKVVYPDGREQPLCKLLPTPPDLILRRFAGGAEGGRFHNRMSRYLLRDLDLTRARFVPNLSGCFMYVRVEALLDVGLFDERYFLYLEDVDLCRRIAQKWDTVFYPHATIVHEYANGSYRDLHHLKLHAASAVRYFNKWGWLRDPIRDRLNARTFDDSAVYADGALQKQAR